ncbi:hypothetical protein J1TS3_36050 [Siminovitchia fordii]|uniref:Uncharacterized protein n=1 Tax=Siminovitchia fordii TaxID=254759 RepID=A0ABQ4K9S9_9BACI|nr:hypothetical protein J1TS3_36050 [Siminovitchia fordii]
MRDAPCQPHWTGLKVFLDIIVKNIMSVVISKVNHFCQKYKMIVNICPHPTEISPHVLQTALQFQ